MVVKSTAWITVQAEAKYIFSMVSCGNKKGSSYAQREKVGSSNSKRFAGRGDVIHMGPVEENIFAGCAVGQ